MTPLAIDNLARDPARAERDAREALAASPDDADALLLLGAALRLQGRPDAARAVIEPLAARLPRSWAVQFEWGRLLLALGLSRAAMAPLSRAVAARPDLASAWTLVGDTLMFSGQIGPAQDAYDRRLAAVIGAGPLSAPARALTEGRLDAAEKEVRAEIGRRGAGLGAAQLLAEILARLGRLGEAETILAECVRQAPDADLARESYAVTLFRAGKWRAAIDQADALLAGDPRAARARMVKAAALTQVGDHAAAAKITACLLEDFPDQPHGWLVHGAGLRTLGRIEEAAGAWRRCLELDPDCSEAVWSLANLKTWRLGASDLAAIEGRLARADLASEDRANLLFALGKAREDAGAFAQAFEGYAAANALERPRRAWDGEVISRFVETAAALFTPAFLAERAGWGEKAEGPIFIVGLPRSGSTLVEQILSSHSSIEATAELSEMRLIADWIAGPARAGRRALYLEKLAALSAETCARLGTTYLDGTAPYRARGAPRFTDKAGENFLHAGLIRLVLPAARIIDVRRHPLATGVSAFSQHFAHGWSFAYDLADLGRYYADYVKLMAHFDAVAPGLVHRVIYEDLVTDTEGETRRLLAFLDLPYEAACLRFFENPRPVATPSSQQVRSPIYGGAIDHWRNFEPWLGPLKAALGETLDAWR